MPMLEMRCLIVDDNISITQMLSQFLKLKGHECTVSNDGRNGLQLIKQNHHDVVILDLAMPEFSGFDIIDGITQNGKINDQTIIVLTASSISKEQEEQLIAKGVKSCLRKPVSPDVLLKTLASVK